MDAVHAHLLLNHIPILGTLFGLLLLLYALVRKNDEIKKVSLGSFVIIGLITIPVFLSGLRTAVNLEGVADAQTIIVQHQEAALLTLLAVVLLGIASFLSLWLTRDSPGIRPWMVRVVLALAVISAGLGVWTGNLGGQIRHPEIRAGSMK